jgi:hypothetical protein
MWRLCAPDYSNAPGDDSDRARRIGRPFNLHVTMPVIADEKMSPSDAEPSETTATTGCPARSTRLDGIAA